MSKTSLNSKLQHSLRITYTHTLLYSLVLCLFWAATFKTLIIASCHHMHLTCLIYSCQCAVPVYNIKQHIKWPHIFFSVAGNITSYPLNDLCVVWLRKEKKWDQDRFKVGSLRRWVSACLSAVGASRNRYGTRQHCRDLQICSTPLWGSWDDEPCPLRNPVTAGDPPSGWKLLCSRLLHNTPSESAQFAFISTHSLHHPVLSQCVFLFLSLTLYFRSGLFYSLTHTPHRLTVITMTLSIKYIMLLILSLSLSLLPEAAHNGFWCSCPSSAVRSCISVPQDHSILHCAGI